MVINATRCEVKAMLEDESEISIKYVLGTGQRFAAGAFSVRTWRRFRHG
jgi:hypothetical protein